MNETGWVWLEAIPTDQQIEHSHGKCQASLEALPDSMHDFFEMANRGEHGENRFDNHALIVDEWLTHL